MFLKCRESFHGYLINLLLNPKYMQRYKTIFFLCFQEMLNHAMYYFLCKYNSYLRGSTIYNLKVFKCVFDRKIFVVFIFLFS
jgi:hypothetical protein